MSGKGFLQRFAKLVHEATAELLATRSLAHHPASFAARRSQKLRAEFIVTDGVIVTVSPLVNHLMFVILSPSAFLTSSTKQYYTGLTKEH